VNPFSRRAVRSRLISMGNRPERQTKARQPSLDPNRQPGDKNDVDAKDACSRPAPTCLPCTGLLTGSCTDGPRPSSWPAARPNARASTRVEVATTGVQKRAVQEWGRECPVEGSIRDVRVGPAELVDTRAVLVNRIEILPKPGPLAGHLVGAHERTPRRPPRFFTGFPPAPASIFSCSLRTFSFFDDFFVSFSRCIQSLKRKA
jgi:hypothetical protein